MVINGLWGVDLELKDSYNSQLRVGIKFSASKLQPVEVIYNLSFWVLYRNRYENSYKLRK